MIRKFVLLATLLASIPIYATNFKCSGKITHAYIDANNNLMIHGDWRKNYTRLCQTDGGSGVDTVTCSLWFSLAVSSMTHDKQVVVSYKGVSIDSMNCATIPTYDLSPAPHYFLLVK